MHEFTDKKALTILVDALGLEAAETIDHLINLFEKNCQEKIILIKKFLTVDNFTEIGFLAHTLKGNAANLSAISLKEKFHMMEEQAKVGAKEEILQLIQESSRLLPLVVQELRNFVKELPR